MSQATTHNWTETIDRFQIEQIDLKSIHVFDTSLALSISEEVCTHHGIVPISIDEGNELVLAMSNPFDILTQELVKAKTGFNVRPVFSPRDEVDLALAHIFSDKADLEDTLQDLVEIEDDKDETEAEEESIDLLRSQATDAPAVVFVNTLLIQAVQERASDIHIEPQESHLRIRLRTDGMLREFKPANKRLQQGVTARIKILADLDISERRIPQDGRVKFKIMGRSVDVRVSTIPGIYGEKIVMRILDQGSTSLNIDDLGIADSFLTPFKTAAKKTQGMILVTGPTGSGKTTTLYSVLNYINSPSLNIITVEDPVEYRLNGINQVQARPGVGLTFASALRSILRQDPDIVMVGEVRDFETAEIAVKASLTGHLVLSTLHTNSAISTITRLLNMGVDKFLIVSSLSVIVAQRLVRKICANCKEPYDIPEEIQNTIFEHHTDLKDCQFYHGSGCKQCAGSGFKGRAGIHEVLFLSPELKRLIVEERSEAEILQQAISEGMHTLSSDGLIKASKGITSLEEVLRVS